MLTKAIFVTSLYRSKRIIIQNEFIQMKIYGQKLYPNAIIFLICLWYQRLLQNSFLKRNILNFLIMLLVKRFVIAEVKDLILFPCFNKQCTDGKFHLDCLKLKNKPRRKWLCPDCRQQQLLSSEVSVDKILDELDSSILIIIERYLLFFWRFPISI